VHNCKTSQRFCFFHLLLPLFVINSLWSLSTPLSKSALTITPSCVSIFSTPIFNYTSLSILKVLLTSLWLPLSFAVLSGSPAHMPSCCAFPSKRHATFLLLHPHYSNSSSFLLKTTLCFLFSSIWHPCFLHLSHIRYETITSSVYYPNSNRHILSGMLFPQCSCALCHRVCIELLFHPCCASHGLTTRAITAKSLFIFTLLFFSFGLTIQGRVQESVMSHDECGKVVHRLCSSCVSSVQKIIGTLSSFFCQLR